MRSLPRPVFAALYVALLPLLAPASRADDGDAKILDRQPRWPLPGVRAARAATPEAYAPPAGAQPGSAGPVFLSPLVFPHDGIELLSWVSIPEFGSHTSANDCWGYTSPSGREYAILGLSNGTGFVEITQPDAAEIVATLPGPVSLWRCLKTYGTYAYAGSEGGEGIQVFDLSQIDQGVVTHVGDVTAGGDTTATHTLAVDTTAGFLYRCGGGDNGLRIYSLANPAVPSFVGSWGPRYVHEAQVHTYTSGPWAGRQIAFACSGDNGGFDNPGLDVLDVTNKGAILELDRFFYPGAVFSHQCWLSDDGTLLYLDDELDEDGFQPTTTYVLNVSNLANVSLAGIFDNGNDAIGHNLYVRDERLFEANYRSGLRVFDLSVSATNPPEIAFFDTYPENDQAAFNGNWTNYPFFPSGVVIASDLEKGLFVWHVGPPTLRFSYVTSLPALLSPLGASLVVHLAEDRPGDLVPGSERLHLDGGNGWQSLPLLPLGGGDYQAAIPPLPCGWTLRFYFSAQSTDGITWTDPSVAAGQVHSVPVTPAVVVAASYEMESAQGWVAGASGDNASTGLWTRGDPVGTAAQPENDHSTPGTQCWFTGQGVVGGGVGDNDVDGGTTTLLSPILDLSALTEARVSFWYWYVNSISSFATPDDAFRVDVSADGGGSWTNVLTVAPTVAAEPGAWKEASFRVADFVTPSAQVRLRFQASDLGDGDLVEATVDDVRVEGWQCRDCDDDGTSDGMAILAGAADGNHNGVPDTCDGFLPQKRPVPSGGLVTPSVPGGGGASLGNPAIPPVLDGRP